MENASQALIIAAGVLIGVIILSMAVYLFNVFGGYASETQNKIDEKTLSQFNDKFLRYNGLTNLTIQDLITVKNYALENNKKYGGYNTSIRAEDNNEYIDVYYAESKVGVTAQSALVLDKSDEELLKEEIQKNNNGSAEQKKLTCKVDVNSLTGRVNKIYFYRTKTE